MKILVVDDNKGTRNAIELWCTRLGFTALACRDAEEGLLRLKEGVGAGEPVEVILTDQLLPGMTGLELIRSGQRLAPGMKGVLITALPDERLRSQTLAMSGCRYLAKPFTPEDLLKVFLELEQEDDSSFPEGRNRA